MSSSILGRSAQSPPMKGGIKLEPIDDEDNNNESTDLVKSMKVNSPETTSQPDSQGIHMGTSNGSRSPGSPPPFPSSGLGGQPTTSGGSHHLTPTTLTQRVSPQLVGSSSLSSGSKSSSFAYLLTNAHGTSATNSIRLAPPHLQQQHPHPSHLHHPPPPTSNTTHPTTVATTVATAVVQGGDALSESRTIFKVKRFLCTLIHFGVDISPDVGEKVKELVFNLVAGSISTGEFHHVVQEVTNFPLRSFVLPFLKSNIPLLARDIATLALLTSQTPLQYLKAHQNLLLDMPTGSGTEHNDIFNSDSSPSCGGLGFNIIQPRFNGGKRKSPLGNGPNHLGTTSSSSSTSSTTTSSAFAPSANDSPHHLHTSPARTGCGNGILEQDRRDSEESGTEDGPTAESGVKRLKMANGSATMDNVVGGHGTGSSRTNGVGAPMGDNAQCNRVGDGPGKMSTIRQQQRVYPHSWRHHASLFGREGLNGASTNEGMQRTSGIGPRTTPSSLSSSSTHHQHDEEWKNIHVMLNCILGMVDKTKRALTILQQRQMGQTPPGTPLNSYDLHEPNGSRSRSLSTSANQASMNELLAATLRNTEEKVIEVRRRAEEAVQDVKRAAMTELQRAVAMAEKRAVESVANERNKIEKYLLLEAASKTSRAPSDDKSRLTDAKSQCCWNCGRQATETCSGCNLARYCSQFCQHKDWEGHHKVCGFQKDPPLDPETKSEEGGAMRIKIRSSDPDEVSGNIANPDVEGTPRTTTVQSVANGDDESDDYD
ncbi:protein CBFA2T1-like isoform X2 [Tigriopus californicus]|nr:protein CBFA2T1-like isoform X2 [Tigriopus californicus]